MTHRGYIRIAAPSLSSISIFLEPTYVVFTRCMYMPIKALIQERLITHDNYGTIDTKMPNWFQNIVVRDYVARRPEVRRHRKNDNAPSPLLQLPPELRNRIYHMCLPADGPIHFNANLTIHSWDQLLRVCRTIREEASPVFYGNIYFEARDRTDYTGYVQRWLASLPADTFFRRVRLELPNYCRLCRGVRSTSSGCSLVVSVDFGEMPVARVHLQCENSDEHTDYAWRDLGQGEQTEGLGSIVDRINGRKACGGMSKQDWLDVSDIFNQIEEEDQRNAAAAREHCAAMYEADLRRAGLVA